MCTTSRSEANDLMEGSAVNYAVMWLSAVIGPFLLATGIVRKRTLMFVAGVFVQLFVYSAMGAKSVIVSILVVPVLAFILRDCASFGLKLTWGSALLTLVLYLGRSIVGPDSLSFWLLSLVFMRTFGIPGLNTAWYQDFFQRNPLACYFPYQRRKFVQLSILSITLWVSRSDLFIRMIPRSTRMLISGPPTDWRRGVFGVSSWFLWCALWSFGYWTRRQKDTICGLPPYW